MAGPKVFLQMSFGGVRFEAGLNGSVLARGGEDQQHSTFVAADHWVLPAHNAITARVMPGLSGEPRHSIGRLALYDSPVPEGDALLQWSWVHDGGTFDAFDVSLPCVPPRLPKSAVWKAAQVHKDLTDEVRAGVAAAALALVAAFEQKQLDLILGDLVELRTKDMAAVLGNDLAKSQERLRKAHEGLVAKGGWRAVKEGDLRLQLVAGGRAVYVRAGHRELLETADAQIPVYFGLVDGRWRVVR